MRKRLITTTVFPLLLTLLAASFTIAAGEKVDLKLKLDQGKTYRTRLVTDQKMKTEVQGQPQEMLMKQTMDMAMAVQEVNAGLATIGITFERIASSMESAMGKMEFDSAEPGSSNNPQAKMLGAMAGSSYTLVTDEHGEVKELRGVKEMLDKMFDSFDVGDERMKETMKGQFSQMYGEDASKSMMGQVFGMLPPGPVAVGETWTKSMDLKVMGSFKTETSYTLNSVSGGKAVIGVHATFNTGDGSEPADMGPMKVQMNISGEQNGTIEIDMNTGLVTGGSATLKASGMQKITGGQQDMEMPVDMEVTTSWQPL